MSFPSFNLLAQSILSGLFIGSLYGLIGLGLGLTWGLPRQINLAHFGLVFLAAYMSYHMATVWKLDPLLALLLLPPLLFRVRRRHAVGAGAFCDFTLQFAAGDFRHHGGDRKPDASQLDG